MSQRLHAEYWVPVAVPKVFAFFADPHNLPRIMPPARGAKILKLNLVPPTFPKEAPPRGFERMAGAGTEIYFKFRAIPYIPVHERWTALITEFRFNQYFSDVQKQGPFKSWHHTHFFDPRTIEGREGTIVRDEIEYEVGFGVVGRFLETIIFQRMMASIFEYRKGALSRVFAAETRQAEVAQP